MRAPAAIARWWLALAASGCNVVFGLEPGSGDDEVAIDGGGGDGDDGGVDPCSATGTLLCARFDTDLTGDGFGPPTVAGNAMIALVAEAPRFARASFSPSGTPVQATLAADRTGAGPVAYRLTFLIRAAKACAPGSADPTEIELVRVGFAGTGVSVALSRQLTAVRFAVTTLTGTTSVPWDTTLADRFYPMQIDVDFAGDTATWTLDGQLIASVPVLEDPASGQLLTIVVGPRATNPPGDCQLDYDDVIVTAGNPSDTALQLPR